MFVTLVVIMMIARSIAQGDDIDLDDEDAA